MFSDDMAVKRKSHGNKRRDTRQDPKMKCSYAVNIFEPCD